VFHKLERLFFDRPNKHALHDFSWEKMKSKMTGIMLISTPPAISP